MATDYRRLEVWKAAKALAVCIYRKTRTMPSEERFNLVSQLQRASVSVVANIAEGAGRGTDLDFARFVRIALGSLSETAALLDLAHELGFVPFEEDLDRDIRDLQVRLTNLNQRLQRDAGRIREEQAEYDTSPPGPSSATVSHSPQP